jgi:Fe2+ or Zn2+ uptake regulation protein
MQRRNTQRNTKTKMLVEHVFSATREPISVLELFSVIQKKYPKTAYSTIFRIVKQLEQSKKIHTVDWRERGSRYEWALLPHHHHIVCEKCGIIADLEDADVNYNEAKIRTKTGFIITHHSIELEGVCVNCR